MKKKANYEVSELKKHIGFWLRLVSNHVSHAFAKKLLDSGITVAEWVVLREMYGKGDTTSPSLIAELTGLTRGAISKLVDRLIAKKLILREGSAQDRRYQHIKLTANASKLVPVLAQLADKNDEEFFSALSAKEKQSLIDILKKITISKELTVLPIN